MADQTSEPTFAEILELFKETATRFKETDAKFKETDTKFKETDARLDRRFRETDANLRRLENLFISQWGKLMEALVQPGVLNLFRARGIDVHYVYPRAKSQQNGNTMEIKFQILKREVDKNLGYEVGIYTLNSFKDGKQVQTGQGKFFVVTKKIGNKWFFRYDSYSNLKSENNS